MAIRETRAAAELTGERVLAFARSIGSDAAVEFFGACWETKAVAQLTDERILTYARSIGGDASREYFRAIRETMAATELTGEKVLAFARAQEYRLALEYFRAIRETKSVAQLTGDNVLLFAESIGKGPARAYFRAIGSTKAVVELTGRGLLDMSGVIRSIGSDAALDYFLAIATTGVVPPTSRAAEGGNGSDPTAAVPVLTLLDIPTYDGYRSAGLFGASAAFWWGMWQLAYLSPGGARWPRARHHGPRGLDRASLRGLLRARGNRPEVGRGIPAAAPAPAQRARHSLARLYRERSALRALLERRSHPRGRALRLRALLPLPGMLGRSPHRPPTDSSGTSLRGVRLRR